MSAALASQTIDSRKGVRFAFPVAAATTTLIGVLAALDGNHRLVNASDAAARRVVGVHALETNNSAGAAGDLSSEVEVGLFKLSNSVANAVTDAHIGLACWVEDNQTVASVVGANSVVAGIVAKVDADGVWVHVGIGANPHLVPQAVTLASTNGTAAAASANLANLAAEAEKIGDDLRAIHAALVAAGILKAA